MRSQASCVALLAGIASLACPLAIAQAARYYTVLDRGPSLVRMITDTPALNNKGDVALWHSVRANLMPGLVLHGGQAIKITGEKDFSLVYPADINDRRVVVGTLQAPQDLRFTHAFKWSDSGLEILPSLGGSFAAATSVNARGEVVGSAQTITGTRHAVLWRPRPIDLGLLAQGDYSSARDINDQSDVVGEANLVRNGKPRAFLWHAGQMQQLPNLPGGSFCSAQAVSNTGLIAGSCDLANGAAHGVIWRNGSVEDLGALGDEVAPSTALDINDQGQVVGTSEAADGKLAAFLWENGKMIDLNKAIAANSGWILLVASRINNQGEILGRGYLGGSIHAFLLQPTRTR